MTTQQVEIDDKEETIRKFRRLIGVGETNSRKLYEAGCRSYADIVAMGAMTMHNEFEISLAASLKAVSDASERVEGTCPNCRDDEFGNGGGSIDGGLAIELECLDCGWFGSVDAVR